MPNCNPSGAEEQMFNWECSGLCIFTYLTLDSAAMGLIPGAITTPGAINAKNVRGWVFHMLIWLSELGRFDMACIGRSWADTETP